MQVHAYYRKCNNGALCNCGAAIRSGESAFIVNFCNVNGHQNHYVTQKICKDHEMQVTANGNTYTVSNYYMYMNIEKDQIVNKRICLPTWIGVDGLKIYIFF